LSANLALLSAKYSSYPQIRCLPALSPRWQFAKIQPVTRTYDATGIISTRPPAARSQLPLTSSADRIGGVCPLGSITIGRTRFLDPTNVMAQVRRIWTRQPQSGLYIGRRKWDFRLIAKNLADKQYSTSTLASSATLASEGLAGPPRTILLRVTRIW